MIVTHGTPGVQAAKQATSTIPIAMAVVGDALWSGLVSSLARPDGNITGFAQFEFAASSKWIQLLKDVAPGMRRLLVVYESATATVGYIPAIETGVRSFGLELTLVGVRAIAAFAREPDGGLVLLSGPMMLPQRDHIVGLAARHRLPAIYPLRFYAESGGLMSYSVDSVDMYRHSASYVDRILRGAKPGDLPVQQPTRIELVINLKTAKALGIAVPATLLALADEVIE